MLEKVEALIEKNKKLKKASSKSSQSVKSIFNEKYDVNDWKLEVEQVAIDDNKLLRSMVDSKKALIQKGCVVLLNAINNKVAIVCGVTDNLIDTVSAKDVVYTLSDQLNGRGGGRPDFAQGAGESENINEFVTSIVNTVKSLTK